jgi:Predicted transcriptional regulators
VTDSPSLRAWADRFALLGDPSRLSLLVAIRRDGPVSVSDLAEVTGIKPTAVSQSLRLMRVSNLVQGHRDGRRTCYELTDEHVNALLDHVLGPTRAEPVR